MRKGVERNIGNMLVAFISLKFGNPILLRFCSLPLGIVVVNRYDGAPLETLW